MRTRILLGGSEALLREALALVLKRRTFAIVAEALDGREAVSLSRKLKPGVAILDMAMPVLNGVLAARQISRMSPATEVILLDGMVDVRRAAEAFENGARGLVLKTQTTKDPLDAIRVVSGGRTYITPRISKPLFHAAQAYASAAKLLGVREQEVLRLVAEGLTSKQVAGLLHISQKTAEFHRSRIMRKLEIHDTVNLVRYAIRQGFVAP